MRSVVSHLKSELIKYVRTVSTFVQVDGGWQCVLTGGGSGDREVLLCSMLQWMLTAPARPLLSTSSKTQYPSSS